VITVSPDVESLELLIDPSWDIYSCEIDRRLDRRGLCPQLLSVVRASLNLELVDFSKPCGG
jgi:hypothetical protein